ncbi:MAG: phosphotransferase [Actinomycetota bacterium]|nr:phosphotransferase [Actinomycetota bacterium]
MARAEDLVATRRPDSADGFVHGDLWQGNVLWDDATLTSVLDWDCAGRGPAGVDLGSLRCDAAICFGLAAAEDVLAGWQDQAGRPAEDVAYWDAVAALSTPPDMGWFPDALADQGRLDRTQELLLDRRDRFLAAAIGALDRL